LQGTEYRDVAPAKNNRIDHQLQGHRGFRASRDLDVPVYPVRNHGEFSADSAGDGDRVSNRVLDQQRLQTSRGGSRRLRLTQVAWPRYLLCKP
jgi:hypothetical protein